MKNFFHKYKIQIICICAAVAVLTTAFFAGGNIGKDEHSQNQSTTVTTGNFNDNTQQQTAQQYSTKQTETVLESTTKKADDTDTQVHSTSKTETKSSQISYSQNSQNVQNSQKNNAAAQKSTSDNTPAAVPKPVEPQEQETKDNKLYCNFSIICSTVLENSDSIDNEILSIIPQSGIIFACEKVEFSEGESVFNVLQRVCKENKIHLETKWTPIYNSAYIEGINNLYEFDCGENSGWKFCVNGLFPSYGCSRYQLKDGDKVKFLYTCDGGEDIGSLGF